MLSLLRRRPKTVVLIILLVLFLCYVAYCGVILAKVPAFRKHPQRSTAVAYFRGNMPHNILARMLVFKRGSTAYNADLLEWAYHSKLITDTFWNRWILENNLEKSSEEERLELLPHYPLTPTTRLIPLIEKALSKDRYQVLPVLSRANTEESSQIYRTWIQDKIVKPHNASLFIAASGYIAQSSTVSFPDLVNAFWPQISATQKQSLLIRLAAHLPDEPRISNSAFAWAKSAVFSANSPLDCSMMALMGRFLSINDLRAQTLELIDQTSINMKAKNIPLLLHFVRKGELRQTAALVLDRMKDRNNQAVLAIIHHLAHEDITVAEELAEPYLSGNDSEIKKGVIVLLVRHGSAKGRAMIGEAFTGKVPRKTMFISSESYENGNVAADLYSKLASHDYRETGKTWPPSYFGKRPSPEEIIRWKQFIESYPWFPGTDDAYYRLAFSEFAQKDYPACFATIKAYLRREYWPDNDAKPYMMHLLRNLALVSDIADNELPFVPHIRTIASNPLALMLIGSQENVDSVIGSLNWFLSNPMYIQFLNTDSRTLKVMRDVAEQIRNSPPDSVCRLTAAKFENINLYPTPPENSSNSTDNAVARETRDESADDEEVAKLLELCSPEEPIQDEVGIYSASIVQSALYGIFNNFPAPETSAMRIDVPNDPGEAAIRQTASFLNARFKIASIDEVKEHSLDELAALALLHSGRDFEKWRGEFGPTMDFLSAVNNADIPSSVSSRHLDLLKERSRR